MACEDGVGGFDAALESPPPEGLVCVGCSLPLRDPVVLECGHPMCRRCAAQPHGAHPVPHTGSVSGSDGVTAAAAAAAYDAVDTAACPKCGQAYDPSALPASSPALQLMAQMVLNLTAKCQDAACEWKGPLRQVDDHGCPGEWDVCVHVFRCVCC